MSDLTEIRRTHLSTGDLMAQQLGTPALDPAFVIGWHVGKAAADRALAAERAVERRVPEYLRLAA